MKTLVFLSSLAIFYCPLLAQNTLIESSKALKTFDDGRVRVDGVLTFRDSTIMVTADDQLINVGTISYLRIEANTFVASDRTLQLSNGIATGQVLYLECIDGAWQLLDNQTPPNNVNSSGIRNLSTGDIIQLIWNGTVWLEVDFSDN